MKVKLQDVTLSFPAVFEAKTDSFGNTKFRANFLIAKGSDNHKAVQEAIKASCAEKFGAKGDAKVKQFAAAAKLPLRDGDAKEYDGYADNMYLSASNKTKPTTVDRDPTVGLTEADGKLYGGAIVNAVVDIWADTRNDRVNATVLGVQFVEHGDRMGGGAQTASASDFDTLENDPLFG